jgi:hypothetical protein
VILKIFFFLNYGEQENPKNPFTKKKKLIFLPSGDIYNFLKFFFFAKNKNIGT